MSTRHLLIRTCARSRKGLLEESIMIFTQDLLIKTCTRLRKDQDRDNRFAQAWATEMHMDLTKGTICARIYKQSVADQNQDNRFVRACAVKMHMSQEQIYVRIYRKISKNGPPVLREPAQSKCTCTSHTTNFNYAKICREKARAQERDPVLCEPAGLKCTWACHKSNLMRKFRGKMPGHKNGTPVFAQACAIEMHMDISHE